MKYKNLLNFIYPNGFACMNCGQEIFDDDTLICDYCKKDLPLIVGSKCLHCCEPITGAGKYCLNCKGKKFECEKIVSPFAYDGFIKKFIIGLKYDNKKYYADCLGKYMAIEFEKELLPCDIVTCVPLCEKRMKQRGYNQAELLGQVFAQNINKEFYPNLLKRVKETPTQTKLSQIDRRKNMEDAFKVSNRKIVKDKIVVIIDDVYTTGATVSECAKKLTSAGAKYVYAVTAGHTVLRRGLENI